MGTVNLKTGLSPAVWGAGVGVVLLGLVHFFTSASGGDGLLRPIEGSFFEFIGSYLGFFFATAPGLIVPRRSTGTAGRGAAGAADAADAAGRTV